jgi:hypothetical protein
LIKLDARWRSCFNRTNTRKSNDFWISLISIKECESKDQSNCPRQMLDFSRMTVSGGSTAGIPTAESPVVVIEGKNPVQGTSNSAYVKITVTLQNDRLSIRIQLNKNNGDDKWQWLPTGKYNVMFFRIKIFGQMALVMLPKSSDKSTHKLVEHEITDNVRLPTSKAGYFQDFVVKTLSLWNSQSVLLMDKFSRSRRLPLKTAVQPMLMLNLLLITSPMESLSMDRSMANSPGDN